MQQLASFLSGTWQSGRGRERNIHHAISGEALWEVTSEGLDMAAARRYAIEHGGKALHAMTFIERAAMLKAVAKHLLSQKEQFYALSAQTGATKADSWVDIEGVSAPSSPTPASVAANCRTTRCGQKMS
jgi:oxepin-CoA hydrolase/3-oxo-5,6-dehydrosuberyl-CoA semialdehyde dehydrogenase